MSAVNELRGDAERAVRIIRDSGGQVVGRTRLQKLAYLLEITGLGSGFTFEYRHYGPFSEELANSLSIAESMKLLTEEEHPTYWGGAYSVFKTFSTSAEKAPAGVNPARKRILKLGQKANPVSLELAATAAYLAQEGTPDPWEETKKRKPEKAEKWLEDAKQLYSNLRSVPVPQQMPSI